MNGGDEYISDLDIFRLGWERGFEAGSAGDGMAPSADEMFFRIFPNGVATRSGAIDAGLAVSPQDQ